MQGFSISLNGKHLVSISTEGLQVFSVHVHGNTISDEFSSIYVSGGNYEDNENKKYLIWIDNQEINPDDEIEVELLQDGATSRPGNCIEELYPNEVEKQGPPQLLCEAFESLVMRPKVRESFKFSLTDSAGKEIISTSGSEDFSYGFSVLWNWMTPELARVSLTSNSLVGIKKRENGTEHARFKIQYGQKVVFRASGY